MPAGLGITIDPTTEQVDQATLVGGMPRRLLRLSERGQAAWIELQDGVVSSSASAQLARRLTDAGLAHPHPTTAAQLDVTVVIPFFGPAEALATCLETIGTTYPVVVVDDGSPDPTAVAAVAVKYGATFFRRDSNGGPAVARNDGLACTATEYVAFLDSDCRPADDWVAALAGHFADPLVAAVAPRIVVADPSATYLGAVSTLDLGSKAARVQAGGAVGYVPTAALLVRSAALADQAVPFDPTLRYGEDVDLVWRLDNAGWRVRYDPTVEVGHCEPATWSRRLAKRFRYGSSAAPLSRRHPGSVPPAVMAPWPALAVVGAVARRPSLAAAGLVGSTVMAARVLNQAGLPAAQAPGLAARGAALSWSAAGRTATQLAAPLLVAATRRRRDESRRTTWQRRATLAAFVSTAPLVAHRARAAHDQPITAGRFVAGRLLDDLAYGAGVYAGCLHDRTIAPLRPALSRTTGAT